MRVSQSKRTIFSVVGKKRRTVKTPTAKGERSKMRQDSVEGLHFHVFLGLTTKFCMFRVPSGVEFDHAGDVEIDEVLGYTFGNGSFVCHSVTDGFDERETRGENHAVGGFSSVMRERGENSTLFADEALLMASEKTRRILGSGDGVTSLQQFSGQS